MEALLADSEVKEEYKSSSVSNEHLTGLATPLVDDYPLLGFYLLFFQTIHEGTFSITVIKQCEAAYYQWYEHLHLEDQSFFFVKLSTLLNRSMGQQHPKARERYFALQQFGFAKGIFLRLGNIHLLTFLNICMVGTSLGKLDWVEQFRTAHLPQVAPKDRSKAALLSEAHLAYGRADYAKVYTLAGQVNRLPKLLRLQFYGLQIKALTERYLRDQIAASILIHYLRSAKAFVRYHSDLQEKYQAPMLGMVQVIQKMIQLKEKGRKNPDKQPLKTLLESYTHINAGEWLREKIEQL